MDKNNIAFWHPILQRAEIPTPKTFTVTIPGVGRELMLHLEEKVPLSGLVKAKGLKNIAEWAKGEMQTLSTREVFIRSGLTSMKHSWGSTCMVNGARSIWKNLCNIAYESLIHDLDIDTWSIREFLTLDYTLQAFNGMPVAREVRFFIHKGAILHEQAYWPALSVKEFNVSTLWDQHFRQISDLNSVYVEDARDLALKVAHVFRDSGEAWSVDVCMCAMDPRNENPLIRQRSGMWFVTDMALAERSYFYTVDEDGEEKEGNFTLDLPILHKPLTGYETPQEKMMREHSERLRSLMVGAFTPKVPA